MQVDTISNERVRLRRFTVQDASTVQRLAGDAAVADTTLSIPHPYPPGEAEHWIAGHEAGFENGTAAVFAVIVPDGDALVGSISVNVDPVHRHGEIGYWIGRPFWGRGYASAALRLMAGYCFSPLELHRVYAHHMARNPASGRVMQNAGFQREGFLREHTIKAGRYEDIVIYGLLKSEFGRGDEGG